MLKAVIFDLDGILIDSTQLQIQADREFIKSFGKLYLPAGSREGMRIIDIVREYQDIYTLPGSTESLYAKRQKIYFHLVHKYLRLFPDAFPLLDKLKQRQLQLALVTSGDRDYTDLIFKKFPQLRIYFEAIITSEDVARGKPNPDVYHQAVNKLAIKPDQAIVVEDSVNGIMAAKLAGISVICVPNKYYPEADYSQADRIFHTLEEVTGEII